MSVSREQVAKLNKDLDRSAPAFNESVPIENPLFPQVHIEIGSQINGDFGLGAVTNISVPPEFIISFEYEERVSFVGDRNDGMGNSFVIDLFDRSFGLLSVLLQVSTERAFIDRQKKINGASLLNRSAGSGEIRTDIPITDVSSSSNIENRTVDSNTSVMRFRWGYSNNMSDWRDGVVMSIVPGEITKEGIYLKLTGLDQGSAEALNVPSKTYGGSILSVLKEICLEMNWVLEIDGIIESDYLSSLGLSLTLYKLLESTEVKNKVCNSNRFRYVQSIIADVNFGKLISVGFSGRTDNGKAILKISSLSADLKNNVAGNFVINVGKDTILENSKVLSFSVDVKGALEAFGYGAKDLGVLSTDRDTLQTVLKTVSYGSKFEGKDVNTPLGRYDIVPSYNKDFTVGLGGSNITKEYIANYFSALKFQAMEADLSVVGSIQYEPFTYVNINVILLNGLKFYTSGLYLIKSVTHSISAGSYITKLKLFKDGTDYFGERVINEIPISDKIEDTGLGEFKPSQNYQWNQNLGVYVPMGLETATELPSGTPVGVWTPGGLTVSGWQQVGGG